MIHRFLGPAIPNTPAANPGGLFSENRTMPTLADFTTSDMEQAAQRAIEAIEGESPYSSPWVFELKPLANPMVVIYYSSDYETYQREVTFEIVGDMLNAVLSENRTKVESRTLWIPIEETAMMAAFKFDGSPGEKKQWSGLIFRAGEYKDKGITVTQDHIRQIVENFDGPVPLMSEHEDSLIGRAIQMDGGYLVKVWAENDNTELHGEIDTPGWLDVALRNIKKSVSVGLAAFGTKIVEISLVNYPRVADAAVYSAFRTQAAVSFAQSPTFTSFSAKHPQDAEQIKALAKTAENPKPAPAPARAQKENHMTFNQKLLAMFNALPPEKRDEIGIAEADLTNPANFSAAPAKPDPRDLAFANERAERLFNELMQDAKVTPGMKEQFITVFGAVLKADGNGTIQFNDLGRVVEGNLTEAFLKIFKDSPARFGIGERIPNQNPDDEKNFSDDKGAWKDFDVKKHLGATASNGGN